MVEVVVVEVVVVDRAVVDVVGVDVEVVEVPGRVLVVGCDVELEPPPEL